jgi:dTDP-4-dehydrorhamnose reductase
LLEQRGNGSAPAVLVIGADGQIGRELVAGLPRHGLATIGTTRHRQRVSPDRVYLDLEGDLDAWPCPENIGTAILAAAVTRLDACERDPEATTRINVASNLALADRLSARGIHVIFLSSNQVFDGIRPYRQASEPASPRTHYGRQKATVEHQLLARHGRASILRLTKVVTPGLPLLGDWARALRSGSPIRPFRDMVIAPIPVAFVVETIARMVQQRPAGVTHASGPVDVAYADVARYIARRLGAEPGLVQPWNASDAGFPPAFAPRHTTLDTTRLRDELGLIPPDVWPTIDAVLPEPDRCPA